MSKNELKKKIGMRIAQLRDSQKWKQEALSEYSEISVNAISKIERGITDPQIFTLYSLAKAFNITLSQLLNEDDLEIATLSETLKDIINLLKTEKEDTVKSIYQQIKISLEMKNKK